MSDLQQNIEQAISDFDDIEAALVESGIDVPTGTDTKEYGNKVRELAGKTGAIVDQAYNPTSVAAQSGIAVAEALASLHFQYVESLDSENYLNLYDLESGTYILYGYFLVYPNATKRYSFTKRMLVSVSHGTKSTCIQVFYPAYNTIQYLNIWPDDTLETGYDFERKDAELYYSEDIRNRITELTASVTDEQYPTAKAVFKAVEQTANAVKGTASGEAIRIDDVSPIEHIVKAKVGGKNLFGFNGRSVLDFGGYDNTSLRPFAGNGIYTGISASNYYDPLKCSYSYDEETGQIEVTTQKAWYGVGVDFKVSPRTTYFVSGEIPDTCFVSIAQFDENGKHISYQHCKDNSFTTEYNAVWVLAILSCQLIDTAFTFANIQIEVGDTATEYEPYIDPSTVTVTRCGKNFWHSEGVTFPRTVSGVTVDYDPDTQIYTFNGTSTSAGDIYTVANGTDIMRINAGETWTLKVEVMGGDIDGKATSSGKISPLVNTVNYTNTIHANTDALYVTKTYTEVADITKMYFYVYSAGTVFNNFKMRVQFELNNKPTSFEKFKDMTDYTPEADGTVNGITSLSPTMTLLTDTAGANIEAEYNRDTNAVVGAVNADIAELDRVTTELIEDMGEMDTALDSVIASQESILAMQNALIGGDE